jgi:hypothetical protein
MNDEQAGHWICQICDQPTGDDGIIEIINVNIDLGPIGTYPVRATEDGDIVVERFLDERARAQGVNRERLLLSAADLADMPGVTPNNAFVVRHLRCTADCKVQGYWIATSRAATLDQWIGWVLHLEEKEWMGREDFLAMLKFWWTHKGAQPPTSM